MKKFWKALTATALAASMAVSLAACGGSSSSSSSAGTASTAETSASGAAGAASEAVDTSNLKDTMNVAYNAQPSTFDPHVTGATATAEMSAFVFETTEDGDVKPQLCESYEASDDNKDWTFKLRQGVKFSNGDEMKADDVVASMNRWLEKSSIASKSIQTDAKEQFTKVDDYTVEIKLGKACVLLPDIIANFATPAAIMPASVVESAGDDNLTVDKLIGTGPMKYDEWKVDNYLKLTKNEYYKPFTDESSGSWGNRSMNFSTLMVYFVTDTSTRLNGVISGDYDLASTIAFSDVQQLKNTEGVNMVTGRSNNLTIVMNKSEESVLHDPEWRRALSYALNLDDIMEAAYPTMNDYKAYTANACYFGEGSPWYADISQSVKQDTDKAKSMLKELGYSGETLKMMTTQAYPDLYNASLTMKEELEAVGVKVDLQVYDWGTMLTHISDKTAFDLYPMNYPDDNNPASVNYIRKATASGFTTDEKLDGLMDDMLGQASRDDAISYWKDTVLPYCVDSAQIIELGQYDTVFAVSDKVKNFKPYYGLKLWGVSVEN